MSARSFLNIFVIELRLFLREPIALFFTLFFPLLLLFIFGTAWGAEPVGRGFRYVDVYVPGLFAMLIANLGLMSIPIVLSEYRTMGILKRYLVSPVPVGFFLLAHVLVQVMIFILVAAAVLLVAIFGYHIRFGGGIFSLAAMLLVSMGAFFSVGFLLGCAPLPVRTIQSTGAAVFFIQLFTSGSVVPREKFPLWMQKATHFMPMTKMVAPTTQIWMGDSITQHGSSVLYLGVMTLLAVVLSYRIFRVEE
ncbi:MAG: ABC transporter permease [Polyangia bacterium]